MCDPLTIAGAGLAAAGQVASFVGENQAAGAHNQMAAQAHMNAGLAATGQYEDSQRKYNYEARSTQQQGYDAAMAGRKAVGSVAAQAGASGIDVSSLSISDIINEQRRVTAQNLSNVKAKQADMKAGVMGDMEAAHLQAQGRINSTPFKSGPSAVGLAIGLAGTAVSAYNSGSKNAPAKGGASKSGDGS